MTLGFPDNLVRGKGNFTVQIYEVSMMMRTRKARQCCFIRTSGTDAKGWTENWKGWPRLHAVSTKLVNIVGESIDTASPRSSSPSGPRVPQLYMLYS